MWLSSFHYSTSFNNSAIGGKFKRKEFGDYVSIGDSGCGIRHFLITPSSKLNRRAKYLFNESHIRTRNCVELDKVDSFYLQSTPTT